MAEGTPVASRYLVGIDLGTTNSALAYVDTYAPSPEPKILPVPQWDTDGAAIDAEMLPSFLYLPTKAEWKRGQLKLPLHPGAEPPDYAVGRLARLKASLVPGRVIHSAKSWLCHPGVDREERILPWHSDDVVGDERRSPIEASAAYLRHLKDAWNARFTDRLETQDVVVTVPASFDEVAQRLTLQAAELAGLPRERLRLLEEPQAAFYYWLARKGAAAKLQETFGVAPRTVLICDIGGGTSDFSLFTVAPAADGGAPEIRRIAVSDHLLLGGDNIDLSLAHLLERGLAGGGARLGSRSWAQLVFETRRLKEKALAEPAPVAGDPKDAGSMDPGEQLFVSVAGEGASLFASARTASLTRAEVQAHILDGFFPEVPRDAEPRRQRGALTQLGLPYAQDGAITRHLASFLAGRDVDFVLFTGGTLKPEPLRDALAAQIAAWQGRPPVVLENDAMDLAVALGAAAYARVMRAAAGRIRGGYPRSLYVEVASTTAGDPGAGAGKASGSTKLLCIVNKGFDSPAPLSLPALGLKLLTDKPARFQLFTSPRREDALGAVVHLGDDAFHPLPPLHARLDFAGPGATHRLIDVGLEVALQETGILQLYLTHAPADGGTPRRWQLDFNVRGTTVAPADGDGAGAPALTSARMPPEKLALAREKLEHHFGKKKRPEFEADNPKYLVRDLEAVLGAPRDSWDTPFLRSLWPYLEMGLNRRSRSVGHETSWLYLAGYALRPGYGFELDEWRVQELWRAFTAGLAFPTERQAEEQWYIMWRRVAGGLTREQQEQVFDRIFPAIRKGDVPSPEIYMLAGSLERIEMGQKVRLGNHLAQQIAAGRKQFIDQRMWALARLASRVPLYGGAQTIVRPRVIGEWYKELRGLDFRQAPYNRLTLFLSQGGRVVRDREFDLPEDLRSEFLKRLTAAGAPPEQAAVVQDFVPVDAAARTQLFGESLPAGLVLG
jgi:molecular chaperone DnaK (HSP70)